MKELPDETIETNTRIFPELRTRRLLLRELRRADAKDLFPVWSDPVVTEYLTMDPFASLAQTEEMIDFLLTLHPQGTGCRWAVTDARTGRVLGTCGFHNVSAEHSRAEMGYELGAQHHRRGYMTEAVSTILSYGFASFGFNRVEAFVTVGNIPSRSFLEHLGFSLDGTLRDYEFARGRFMDQWCFSLLAHERSSLRN
jgi:ribosomal-protein-alanine N-acetyltransferase